MHTKIAANLPNGSQQFSRFQAEYGVIWGHLITIVYLINTCITLPLGRNPLFCRCDSSRGWSPYVPHNSTQNLHKLVKVRGFLHFEGTSNHEFGILQAREHRLHRRNTWERGNRNPTDTRRPVPVSHAEHISRLNFCRRKRSIVDIDIWIPLVIKAGLDKVPPRSSWDSFGYLVRWRPNRREEKTTSPRQRIPTGWRPLSRPVARRSIASHDTHHLNTLCILSRHSLFIPAMLCAPPNRAPARDTNYINNNSPHGWTSKSHQRGR